jgi:dephospho-CoA kinase
MEKIKEAQLKLGVTGGIGSGKTSVCKVFRVLGVPVFSADRVAREIMDNDLNVRQKINDITGLDLYAAGALDRALLASLIFNDSDMLGKVNSLVHPLVFQKFELWSEIQTSPYVIMEAAILFESGAARLVDKIATIITPLEERLSRVTTRNRLSRQEVLDRMKNQMDDESRIGLSDYIIYNSDRDMIIPAILKIHEEILHLLNR